MLGRRCALALLLSTSACAANVGDAPTPPDAGPSAMPDAPPVSPTIVDRMHEGAEHGLCSRWEGHLVDADALRALRSGAMLVHGTQGGFSLVSWRNNPAPAVGGIVVDTSGTVRTGPVDLALEPGAGVIQAIGLADGGFVVEWALQTPGGPGTDTAYLVRYDATGAALTRSNELTMPDASTTTWLAAGQSEDELVVAAERGPVGVTSWSWLSFPLDASSVNERTTIPVTDFDAPVAVRDGTLLTAGWQPDGAQRTTLLRAWSSHGERTMSFALGYQNTWAVPMDLGHDGASVVMADSGAVRFLREGSIIEVPSDVQMPLARATAGPVDDSATVAFASDRYAENGGQPVLSILDVSASGTRGPVGEVPLPNDMVIDLSSAPSRVSLWLATDVERDAFMLLLTTPLSQYAAVIRCADRDP